MTHSLTRGKEIRKGLITTNCEIEWTVNVVPTVYISLYGVFVRQIPEVCL